MRIILVEDETDLGIAIKRTLSQKSYVVDWVQDGKTAWNYLENSWTQYTLGIFDWLLPELSGLELIQRLRQQNNPLPVLMLTAKDGMEDRVMGLDAGADDYLVKPFGMSELLARLRALQRRSPQMQPQQLQVGNIALDYQSNSVWLITAGVKQKSVVLTAKEFQFLEYFLRHPGQIITSEQLLAQMWSLEAEPMSNVVAAQIRLLRRKLTLLEDKQMKTKTEHLIETVYGLGYRFNPQY